MLFLLSGAIGIYLMVHGNLRVDRPVLWAHIVAAIAAVAAFLPFARRISVNFFRWMAFALAAVICLTSCQRGLWAAAAGRKRSDRKRPLVPASMEEEGGGPSLRIGRHPRRPISRTIFRRATSWKVKNAENAIATFITSGKARRTTSRVSTTSSIGSPLNTCRTCSTRRKPSQWCAGCHDHAMLFSGRWKKPVREQIDTPEAQAGLGCISCHAISHVDSTMGNAGFRLQYNSLHDLAVSDNPFIHRLASFLTYVNPAPHRRTFLKPFMHEQTSEFCSACHKVHLDVPVNSYRWVRGFNDYDNWQASGVSGQGARSFYYPNKPMGCADCHMPRVKSNDPASEHGTVHSHWFAAANTALPTANEDMAQLGRVEKFLEVRVHACGHLCRQSGRQQRRTRNAAEFKRHSQARVHICRW